MNIHTIMNMNRASSCGVVYRFLWIWLACILTLQGQGVQFDDSFNASPSSPLTAMAIQPDGEIVVGGSFTSMNGVTRRRITRLLPDGSLDLGFFAEANNTVNAIAIQPDGKILLGGDFTTVNGVPRSRLARLHADGRLDDSFVADAGSTLQCIAIQPDGGILVGGSFTSLAGQPRNRIARLHPDGSLDATFNPGVSSGVVYTLAVQADGKILLGGAFTNAGGSSRQRIARLHADGTVDATFDPGANSAVRVMALDAQGHPLVSGPFTNIGGTSSPYLARLLNDPATSALTVGGTAEITWTRGGSAPEIGHVTFDVWDGTAWVSAGSAARIPGGWQATGLSLPATSWPLLTSLPTDRRGPLDTNGPLNLPNILAYAMGIDPYAAIAADMPAIVTISEDADRVTLRFRRSVVSSDASLSIWVSPDLSEDSWIPAVWHTQAIVEAAEDWEIIEAEIDTAGPEKSFFRMKVDWIDP